MSAIGFDIGNVNCVIATAKSGGIDVLLNDEAKRETPGVVSFCDKQRFLGSAGVAFATANPKSTISQIKRLIGRQYKEPSVQEELKLLPFVTNVGPRGGILIELEYMKEKLTFTPVEILGMLFKHLKQIAEKNIESPVADCVIGIPSYFTDLQRREYLDAATIAGLKPLRLMHDGTAIALEYGMYKTDLSNIGSTIVVFVDIGHCDTQVTVAAFEQGGMKVLSHASDENLGGRDFDEVLFKHFADTFKEQYNIDVYSNTRACIRLRASCEKVKNVLSANKEAPLNIECLIEDKDVKGSITREEFENLSHELLNRVAEPCIKALNESGIKPKKIYTIELVGSGSRVPAITKILSALFYKEPTRTLNASECVARGCALSCAMLSPTLKVQDYKIQDIFPYTIGLPANDVKNKSHKEITLFAKGCSFPAYHMLKFNGITPFDMQVFYANDKDIPAGMSSKVGHFMIDSSQSSGRERVRFEFAVLLNKNGVVEIGPASILEDNNLSRKNNNPHPKKMVANSHMSNLAFSENLDVATTKDELYKAQEIEKMLEEQDKKVEQTKDQRNTLESFVYDTRSKLENSYKRFVTDLEKDVITKSLQETEDRLYEDSDDESEEQDYAGKLEDLKKLLEPVKNRYKDESKAQAKKPLLAMIEEYRLLADSLQPRNKKELIKACKEVEEYLEAHSPKDFDQIGWSNFIKKTTDTSKRMCEEAIRYKRSIPKAVEPVNNKIKDEKTKPLLSMIKEYRLVADSLHHENKIKLIEECTGAKQYLSRHSPENYHLIDWSNFINETMGLFKSRCEEAMQYKSSSPKHAESVESDQSFNHMDSQIGNSVDAKQTGKSSDQNQTGKTTDENRTGISIDRNRTGNSMDGNRTGKSMERNQTSKPVERNQTSKPMEKNQTSKLVERNQTSKPVERNQTRKPVKRGQASKPVKPDQTSKLVDANQTDKPMKSDQSSRPVDRKQTCKPGSRTCKPMKPDPTSEPAKPDKISKPIKKGQTSKTVNMGQPTKKNKKKNDSNSRFSEVTIKLFC